MSQDNWKTLVSFFIVLIGLFLVYRKVKNKKSELNEFDPSIGDASDLVSPFHWFLAIIANYLPGSIWGLLLIFYGIWLFFK